MILSGPLSPNMSQGGEDVTETPIVLKGLRASRLGPLKMKKSSKLIRNNGFGPKTWSHHLSIFGHHAFNPFDTKQRAKIAVKFSILRVVMLWSIQS